jgi:hypothetical protein
VIKVYMAFDGAKPHYQYLNDDASLILKEK